MQLKKLITNPFIFFPLITVVILWPITLHIFTLKNDALTYYYPVRTLISDALHNYQLPLWTPYINMGYPLHADMQSGAWNPVIWIFSLLTNYSLGGFHAEMLFYFSFAGIGFYFLCKDFDCPKSIAVTAAIAYQFSGFMIDSVQFFTCISGACYLPFVFLFFRRMTLLYNMKNALLLAFFLFLLFTGGYPSLFIITGYTLLACSLFHFFAKTEKKVFLKLFLPQAGVACLFFLLLSLPAIISFAQHLTAIERGKSQSLAVVLENSMNPVTMLSLLSPFATTANDNWLHSSVLMRSVYMGIIPLIFLIYAFYDKVHRKNKEMIFFLFYAIIMLGMAWGEFFFLRQFAYYTLPLMDSFRHPALFRLFAIFFLLLIAASALRSWEISHQEKATALRNIIITLIALAMILGIATMVFPTAGSGLLKPNFTDVKNLLAQLHFQQRYFIQLPILTAVLLLSYWAILKNRSTRLICLVTIADLFFAAQLNMPVTVFGAKRFASTEKLIDRNPARFPVPDNHSIEENSLNSTDENMLTGSRLPFTKKIGRNDYYITPGNLIKQDEFYESPLKDIVFNNPVLYFADSLLAINKQFAPTANTAMADSSGKIQITTFNANEMEVLAYKKTPGLLVYLQNNYPGWKAFIDGKQATVIPVNITFMAITMPAGSHHIIFKYQPQGIINAWYAALVSFVILVILYCLLFFSKRRSMTPQKEKK